MNIMVFFILNFSFFMSSNLGLFPQTWGLRTEYIIKSLIFTCKSIVSNIFRVQKCKHAHEHMKKLSIVCYRKEKLLQK